MNRTVAAQGFMRPTEITQLINRLLDENRLLADNNSQLEEPQSGRQTDVAGQPPLCVCSAS